MKINIPMNYDTFINIMMAGIMFSLIGVILFAGIYMVIQGLYWMSIIMFIFAWVMFALPMLIFDKNKWFKYVYPVQIIFRSKDVKK